MYNRLVGGRFGSIGCLVTLNISTRLVYVRSHYLQPAIPVDYSAPGYASGYLRHIHRYSGIEQQGYPGHCMRLGFGLYIHMRHTRSLSRVFGYRQGSSDDLWRAV